MLYCQPKSKQVRYTSNQIIDLDQYKEKSLPLQNVDANGRPLDCKDMVDLPFLNEVCTKQLVCVMGKSQNTLL